MPNISQSDCKKWLSGYRPFDYTKAQQVHASVHELTPMASVLLSDYKLPYDHLR
ncbi:hypothetical protein ACT4ZS_20155 (plasmid) [Acinetobacter baumannii]